MACREEEIPNVGDYNIYEIVGKSFIVVRTAPDEIKAFYNSCLHRGRKLVTLNGCKNEFRCPYHGIAWNNDGTFKDNPIGWDFPQWEGRDMSLPQARVDGVSPADALSFATADLTADTVLLVFEKWISTLRQEPTVRVMLPIEIPKREQAGTGVPQPSTTSEYIYEPSPEEVLDALLPRYVETQVYQAVLENKASEWSARMIAMQNATDAAGELIDSLTLFMNKVRQAMITTELMEIVGGAEALRSSGN